MNQQLFGDNDVFQSYGIPMNPTDTTTMPGMEDRQRQQSQDAANNSLISYQQPIDFTDFLNIDENDVLSASGSCVKDK